MYDIRTRYLEHDGGTKFYETVLIHESDGPAILIKRWGAITAKMGGGQFKMDKGSFAVCIDEEGKICREKEKLRPGKGRYSSAPEPKLPMHKERGRSIDTGAMMRGVTDHYPALQAKQILNYFGLSIGVVDEDPDNDIVDEGIDHPTEEERGSHWGSW